MVTISPPVADITIGSQTWTNDDWENDTPGTISEIANTIAAQQALLETVGLQAKAISGDTTLTSDESANLTFIFTGTLTADAAITFAAGFQGLATITNQTSGGFSIICGLASGSTVTIPNGGSAHVYCDGTDFALADGIVRTSTGASVTGDFAVTGNASFGGTFSGAGAATLLSTLGVTGVFSASSDANVAGGLYVTGISQLNGTVSCNAISAAGQVSTAGLLQSTGGSIKASSASGEARSYISSASGYSAWLEFDKAGSQRWLVGKNNTTEGGSNAGSDFDIVGFADDGITSLGVYVRVARADGSIFLLGNIPTSDPHVAGQIWSNSGALTISAG